MKLYFHPFSSSSRRVRLVAESLGITLEHQLVDLARGEQRGGEFARLNPNRKVPVLTEGDLVLWESHAIIEYLCAKTPGQTLYPSELIARADVTRWLFWTSAHLNPAINPITFERMWKKFAGAGEPDLALIARHEQMFHQVIAVLDQHLAARTWISGEALTVADLSLAATLMYRVPAQLPIDAYQNVLALVGRVEALDAWKATEPSRNG